MLWIWNITLFQSVWILSNNSLYRLRSAWEHPLAFVSRVVLYYYVTMVVKRSWIRTWNTFTPFPTHILTVKDGFPFCCFLRNKNRATALSSKKIKQMISNNPQMRFLDFPLNTDLLQFSHFIPKIIEKCNVFNPLYILI